MPIADIEAETILAIGMLESSQRKSIEVQWTYSAIEEG